MPSIHRLIACLGLTLASAAPATFAAGTAPDIKLPANGWVSWDAPAVDAAPAWCCLDDWQQRGAQPTSCNLDGPSFNFGGRDGATTDTVRLYVKLHQGQVQRLRALAPNCPVRTATPVSPLGLLDAQASVAWLNRTVEQAVPANGSERRNELHTHLMAAIALHRGDVALAALVARAGSTAPVAQRKEAVFWIGQTRGEPGVQAIKPIMRSAAEPALREHAGFAVAQSKSAQAPALLVEQAETDVDTQVRSQAWFWLSQTRADVTEAAVQRALRKEADAHVRHQAIFALSQLPAPRAAPALIRVAEDRDLSRDDRKQAVFWLGQSDAPQAAAFLDKALGLGTR